MIKAMARITAGLLIAVGIATLVLVFGYIVKGIFHVWGMII